MNGLLFMVESCFIIVLRTRTAFPVGDVVVLGTVVVVVGTVVAVVVVVVVVGTAVVVVGTAVVASGTDVGVIQSKPLQGHPAKQFS